MSHLLFKPFFSPALSTKKVEARTQRKRADGGKTVPKMANENPLLPAPNLQVPLYDKYEALEVEGPSEGGNSPLCPDMLTKPNQKMPSPNTKATSLKKNRQVLL